MYAKGMTPLFSRKPRGVTLEEQIGILGECGIRMPPAYTVDDLIEEHDRAQYEQDAFSLLLCVLGEQVGEECDEPATDIWYFARSVLRTTAITFGSRGTCGPWPGAICR